MQRPGRTIRLLATALIATVVMGFAVNSATASTGVSVTNGVTLFSANGVLTYFASGLTTTCRWSIGFAVAPSVAKTPGALFARVLPSPGSTFTACNLGITGTMLDGATFNYSSFSGTLPNISSIVVTSTNIGFLFQLPLVGSCLHSGGSIRATLTRNTVTGTIDSIAISGSGITSRGSCPGPITISGTLTVLATKPILQLI